jgi:alpha-tubulin suppressor-like RCC1 family protein
MLRVIGGLTLDASAPIVSGGNEFACALDASGNVQCWGRDSANSLGSGAMAENDQPVPMPLYGPASVIAFVGLFDGALRLTTCATTSAGDLWCWGDDTVGQLGRDLAAMDWNAARVVMPAVREGACSDRECCAVTTSNEVWCWGANDYAQLGRGASSMLDWHPAPVCAP